MFAIPLVGTIAWSYLSSWGGFILPLLPKIPWQVWVGIASIITVLFYGHVRENRGFARCQAEVQVATSKETARQVKVAEEAVKASHDREAAAATKAQQTQEELDATLQQVAKLKNAQSVCLPSSITRGLSGIRNDGGRLRIIRK